MTLPERLEHIEKRLKLATPGPWSKDELEYEPLPPGNRAIVYSSGVYEGKRLTKDGEKNWDAQIVCDLSYDCNGFGDEKRIRGNMDLIASAPTDLALLLKIVKIQSEALGYYIGWELTYGWEGIVSPGTPFSTYLDGGKRTVDLGKKANEAQQAIAKLIAEEK